ncbi:XRE family transcriptional regulator [Rufibacter quisquiliarum]|uniref:Transcriptional regulator with XRE-family HTH domain n=1 Tax=Rufibacter quisquiliarum TaxID=1549639 RepID=A0A839GH37_9BACT|nr:LexA family transcriptional regulator [Rufibacter quisquiliarum]MBA9078974.1 transcriptional regulator with XRE-family HTH domain [Rufibacter quisquiliarum]
MSSNFTGFGERLRAAREQKGLSQSDLAEKLDMKRNTVSNYETEKSYPSLDLLLRLVDILDVSSDYLLSGSEKKVTNDEPEKEGNPNGNLNGNLKPLGKTKSTLTVLKDAPVPYAGMRVAHISKPTKGEVLVATQDISENITVPMVNVKAAANYVQGYQTQEYFEHLEAAVLPRVFTRGKHSILLQVDGDSMEPTYHDGSWVLGNYVERANWLHIPDLEACIVVSNRGIQIKRIKNRLAEGFLRCRSDNRKKHPPFNIQYEDILEIWRVTAYITNYMPNLAEDLFYKVDHIEEQQQDLREMYEEMQAQMLELMRNRLPPQE